ncbi:hypothetical protein E2C01_067929 [Portunus trituberculatus]|uniref:Uncharacterized protein n=1 Tax=Portunus trituberculatus TaxID=210409 RepID=A0A5B7HYS0_PORTR|nr:hypothetical protein [Portunus trituberculatus]
MDEEKTKRRKRRRRRLIPPLHLTVSKVFSLFWPATKCTWTAISRANQTLGKCTNGLIASLLQLVRRRVPVVWQLGFVEVALLTSGQQTKTHGRPLQRQKMIKT